MFDEDLAVKMLEKETELRLSNQTIEEYSKMNEGENYRRVNIEIQKQVLQSFGFEGEKKLFNFYFNFIKKKRATRC